MVISEYMEQSIESVVNVPTCPVGVPPKISLQGYGNSAPKFPALYHHYHNNLNQK